MGLGDLFVYSVFTSSNACYCSMPNFIPQKGENVSISNVGKFCCDFFYYKYILGHHEFIYFRILFIFFINISSFCFFSVYKVLFLEEYPQLLCMLLLQHKCLQLSSFHRCLPCNPECYRYRFSVL